jgi:hypothetical protein
MLSCRFIEEGTETRGHRTLVAVSLHYSNAVPISKIKLSIVSQGSNWSSVAVFEGLGTPVSKSLLCKMHQNQYRFETSGIDAELRITAPFTSSAITHNDNIFVSELRNV